MPEVSVIIPCYNQGHYVDEAVDSLLAQTYRDFEIVIVNDGSTDPFTIEKLDSYEREKCRVLHQVNRGLPGARNSGIRASGGEYVCCLDADDRYHPEFLERCVPILRSDQVDRYGFVTTHVQCFEKSDVLNKCLPYDPILLAVMNIVNVASLFRRSAWEKVGGYNEAFTEGYEDWNFWLALVEVGYEWALVEEALFFYRVRENSMVSGSDRIRAKIKNRIVQDRLDFYSRNFVEVLDRYERILGEYQDRVKRLESSWNDLHRRPVKTILAKIAGKLRRRFGGVV